MAEKIVQAQEKEDSILDLLLQDSVRPVKNNLPTAKYEVTRLSAVLGKTAIFKLTGLPYGRTAGAEAPDRGGGHPDSAGRLRGA